MVKLDRDQIQRVRKPSLRIRYSITMLFVLIVFACAVAYFASLPDGVANQFAEHCRHGDWEAAKQMCKTQPGDFSNFIDVFTSLKNRKLTVYRQPADFSDYYRFRRVINLVSTSEASGSSMQIGFYATPFEIKGMHQLDLPNRFIPNRYRNEE